MPNADPRTATDIDRQIGVLVRTRRLELGMSQDNLASALGITFQQIQKYEKGSNRIAAVTLMRIASHLDTEVAALLPKVKFPKRPTPRK